MPIIKSAIKRARQATKRQKRNIGIKHDVKNATKKLVSKPSAKAMSAVQSELDKAVKKGLIKKNTAARRKALLSRNAKNAGLKIANTPSKKIETPKTAKKTAAKKAATPKKA